MSDEHTAEELLHRDVNGCMGDVEEARLLQMLTWIENESPGERRRKMFHILAEEMSGSVLCEFHWREIKKRLAEAAKVPNVLQ